jgi:hypothetical protein
MNCLREELIEGDTRLSGLLGEPHTATPIPEAGGVSPSPVGHVGSFGEEQTIPIKGRLIKPAAIAASGLNDALLEISPSLIPFGI